MLLTDIFNSDLFKLQSLTAAINKDPYVPGRLGQLKLFRERGITTTSIVLEEVEGALSLIPNTARSAPPNQNKHNKRVGRTLTVPHFPLEDVVMAEEVQNIRAFGQAELQTVQQVINDRLATMRSKHDATLEYGRIGAVKGIIYDSDGSTVIYNLFTEFGVSQDSVDFVLGTTTTDVLGKCATVRRYVEDALGNASYTGIHAVCGKTWWDKFVSHTAVKDAFKYYEQHQGYNPLREDLGRRGFTFGGITFEEYRGSVGGVDFVAASEAHFFPMGVPDLFETCFAPAGFMETVNTVGLPIYVKPERMEYDKGIKFLTESNPISYCRKPKTLVKGTTSN